MSRFYCHPSRLNNGFTLVELMIAMMLGAFLLNGILQIFFSAKQTYRVQSSLANLQENARLALNIISQDVRMAGYWGCDKSLTLTNKFKQQTNFFYQFDRALQGFESTSENDWLPDDPSFTAPISPNGVLPPPSVANSDVLTIRRASQQRFVISQHTKATAPLQLNSATTLANLEVEGIKQGSMVMASNCQNTEIFQVSRLSGSPVSIDHTASSIAAPFNDNNGNLTKTYQGGEMRALNTISYYVAQDASQQKLLYRKIGIAPIEELVDGVEKMQILYGVDTNNSGEPGVGVPDYYVTANLVKDDWDKVVSVRIRLLMATLDNNLTDHPLPYKFLVWDKSPTATVTPKDRKIRRVFTTTIAIRNRLAAG